MGLSQKIEGHVAQKLSAKPTRSAASKPQFEALLTSHDESVEDAKEDESIGEVKAKRENKQVVMKDQKKKDLEDLPASAVQPRKDSGLADEHVETSSNTVDNEFSLVENKKPKQDQFLWSHITFAFEKRVGMDDTLEFGLQGVFGTRVLA